MYTCDWTFVAENVIGCLYEMHIMKVNIFLTLPVQDVWQFTWVLFAETCVCFHNLIKRH